MYHIHRASFNAGLAFALPLNDPSEAAGEFQSPPSSPLLSPQTAAVAPPRSHIPPVFETSSSLPIVHSSADIKFSPKRLRRPYFTPPQLLSFVVLLLVLVTQLFKPPTTLFEESSEKFYPVQELVQEAAPVCRAQNLFSAPLLTSRPHKMALLEEAKRMAREFDYPSDELNRGVKAFIEQMGVLFLRVGES